MTAALAAAPFPVVPSMADGGMTAAEFRRWERDCGYADREQVAADLCIATPTLSRIENGVSPVAPDVERLCRILALLHDLAAVDPSFLLDPRDPVLILRARGLLAVHARGAGGEAPALGSHRGARAARVDRLCLLSALVADVARDASGPTLAGVRRRATAMLREWEEGGSHV